MGLENLYGSEKSFLTAPQQAGSRGIRVNLSYDIKTGNIDVEDFGCQELLSRKMDLADTAVKIFFNNNILNYAIFHSPNYWVTILL